MNYDTVIIDDVTYCIYDDTALQTLIKSNNDLLQSQNDLLSYQVNQDYVLIFFLLFFFVVGFIYRLLTKFY